MIQAHAEADFRTGTDEVAELIETGEASPMHVRDLLLELQAINVERRDVKALREAVVDRYDYKLQQLAEREVVVRDTLQQYVERCNGGEKVSIPDAGTVYLTTKNKGGKLTVADAEALVEFLRRRFPKIVEAASKTTVHLGDALQMAADELDIIPTADGKVVTTAGEVVELPGIGAEPESQTLAVRAA